MMGTKQVWRKNDRGGAKNLHSILPFPNWRCYAWLDEKRDCWSWEARHFRGRRVHVSGECERLVDAKKIAVAAAYALGGRP